VWAWEIAVDKSATKNEIKALINPLEAYLYWELRNNYELVNGDIPPRPEISPTQVPQRACVQVIPSDEIRIRLDPVLRFPRQILHFNQLVDYILNTQDKPHLRQALKVYFDRLSSYYSAFLEI
jgi:hypothetical protein